MLAVSLASSLPPNRAGGFGLLSYKYFTSPG